MVQSYRLDENEFSAAPGSPIILRGAQGVQRPALAHTSASSTRSPASTWRRGTSWTNTFNAQAISLADYGLEGSRTSEQDRRLHRGAGGAIRDGREPREPRFVAGPWGRPTAPGRVPDVETPRFPITSMSSSRPKGAGARALDVGVDLLLPETTFDTLT